MLPQRKDFQQQISGKQVDLFELRKGDIKVGITNYGGRLVYLLVPDRNGNLTDVITGYDHLSSYQKAREPFFGTLVGRYGNRIARGKFSLDGKEYQLEINNGVNALHGGSGGFHSRVWDAALINDYTLQLTYRSKDGEEGYPGNLDVKVTYSLSDDRSIKIEYLAESDQTTIINLTNHTYFNLNGEGVGNILNHRMMINADLFVAIDETSIPLGHLEEVAETPFDFKEPAEIGRRIDEEHPQLINGKGYDHTFVLNHPPKTLGLCAVGSSPETGIAMEVLTTEPGVQFYTGNFLTGIDYDGKGGKNYPRRSAFCLETQHFPDSPNQPGFPSVVLRPGEKFHSETIYRFSVI